MGIMNSAIVKCNIKIIFSFQQMFIQNTEPLLAAKTQGSARKEEEMTNFTTKLTV